MQNRSNNALGESKPTGTAGPGVGGLEGLEVHGYLPAPSEIPEREIGGGDHSSVYASDGTHESDDDAALGFSAVLLQDKNEYCSSAKPYLSLTCLADDIDTPVPPRAAICCVYVCTWTPAS